MRIQIQRLFVENYCNKIWHKVNKKNEINIKF